MRPAVAAVVFDDIVIPLAVDVLRLEVAVFQHLGIQAAVEVVVEVFEEDADAFSGGGIFPLFADGDLHSLAPCPRSLPEGDENAARKLRAAFIIPSAPCKIKRFFAFSAKSARCPVRSAGKPHGERGALAHFALDADPPARLFAQLFDDGKPQSEAAVLAAVRLIHREKAVEDALSVLFGDADARILHGELRLGERDGEAPPVAVVG